MTVGSVPPLLALGNVATTQSGAVPVVPSLGAATTGLAQPGTTTLAAQETALLGASAPQVAAGSALDALALKAAAQAALGEGGLALLMADLSQAQRVTGLPATVQAAITQILALRAPLAAPPTSADLKALALSSQPASPTPAGSAASPETALAAALVSGGPLKTALVGLQQALSTWLANAPAPSAPLATSGSAPPPAAGLPETPSPQAGATPVIASLAQALRASGLPAPIQSALLQALTPLAAPAAAATAPGPKPLNAATAAAAGAPTPSAAPGPGTTPIEAAASAANLDPAASAALDLAALPSPGGATTEVPLLATPAAAPDAPVIPADLSTVSPADIKAAVSSLPTTNAAATASAPAAAEAAAPAPLPAAANALAASVLAALPAAVDAKDALLIFQQIFNTWFADASTPLAATPAAAGSAQAAPAMAGSVRGAPLPGLPAGVTANAANAPPPPYRGGPTNAQPAMPSSLPLNADPVTLGARLLRETNAALAHQELLQIASLPAATQAPAPSSAQNPQWMFEIPFATAQGTAVAQFKITRDGGGSGKDKGGRAPVWRANFSLDVEPMGPVHAQIVLSGDRTWVSLWAEREESVAQLRQQEGLLTSSLKDADFTPEVAFHVGAPRQPATTSGQFLNHAS